LKDAYGYDVLPVMAPSLPLQHLVVPIVPKLPTLAVKKIRPTKIAILLTISRARFCINMTKSFWLRGVSLFSALPLLLPAGFVQWFNG